MLKRHRFWFLFLGVLLALCVSLYSDPDSGLSTALGGVAILQGVWAVAASHLVRKALMDYPEADMRKLFYMASKTPFGAGLALMAIAIIFFGLLTVFSPRARADTLPGVPGGFLKYGPTLLTEQRHYWPNHPAPSLLAALIEQETCPSLKSKSCWNPGARLKSAREEGAGMGQITRAYRADGSLRFDALADLTDRYRGDLTGLSWDTVYQRPDLQLRAVVLMSKDATTPFRSTTGMLHFGDAAYNGGASGVQKERRACALTRGCDTARWFGHVEQHCLKSRQPLYAGRSACDINREHVRAVFLVRRAKYIAAMGG